RLPVHLVVDPPGHRRPLALEQLLRAAYVALRLELAGEPLALGDELGERYLVQLLERVVVSHGRILPCKRARSLRERAHPRGFSSWRRDGASARCRARRPPHRTRARCGRDGGAASSST